MEVFGSHGFPRSVSSDNGKPFVSEMWKGVMKAMGIIERHTVPYRPCGQTVERHNATLKQTLMAYCESHRDWDSKLLEVKFALRTAPSVVTGLSPAFLAYGRELRAPWDLNEDDDATVEETNVEAVHEYAADLQARLSLAHEFVAKRTEKSHLLDKARYDKGRKDITFDVNDLVWRQQHVLSDASKGIAASLSPKRSGPYRVVRRIGRNVYDLVDADSNQPAGRANVDQLLKFVPIPDWATEANLAPAPQPRPAPPPPTGLHNYNLRPRRGSTP